MSTSRGSPPAAVPEDPQAVRRRRVVALTSAALAIAAIVLAMIGQSSFATCPSGRRYGPGQPNALVNGLVVIALLAQLVPITLSFVWHTRVWTRATVVLVLVMSALLARSILEKWMGCPS